jgi:hypothetical protein
MLLQKSPPDTTDRRPERPNHSAAVPGLGTWTFLMQCYEGACFRLVKTKRGVDLYLLGDRRKIRASWHLGVLLHVHRGWRAIQRDQEVFDNYYLIATDTPDEYFVCSLPIGDYTIVPRTNPDGQIVWWYDPGYVDDSPVEPELEPESRALIKQRQRPTPAPVRKPIPRASLRSATSPSCQQTPKVMKARLR